MDQAQVSKSEDGQVTSGVVEGEACSKSPKTSQDVIARCKAHYLSGTWKSLKELGGLYGLHPKTLQARITREGWEHQRLAILSKVESKVSNVVVSESVQYLQKSFARTQKFEAMVEASADQAGFEGSNGVRVLEPDDIDSLTRSLSRLHAMGLSSLRIPAISQLDVTSKGESILQAIERLRNNPQQIIDLTPEQVARIATFEVVPDKPS